MDIWMSLWVGLASMGLLWLVSLMVVWHNTVDRITHAQLTMDEALRKSTQDLWREVAALQGIVSTVKIQMAIFWKDVADDAGRRLHRPHEEAKKMDALIEDTREMTVGTQKKDELAARLRTKVLDPLPESGELIGDITQRRSDASKMLHAGERYEMARRSMTDDERKQLDATERPKTLMPNKPDAETGEQQGGGQSD